MSNIHHSAALDFVMCRRGCWKSDDKDDVEGAAGFKDYLSRHARLLESDSRSASTYCVPSVVQCWHTGEKYWLEITVATTVNFFTAQVLQLFIIEQKQLLVDISPTNTLCNSLAPLNHMTASLISSSFTGKTITRNLFGVCSSLPSFSALTTSRSGPSNLANGFGGALLSPPTGREWNLQPSDTFPGL